MENIDMTLGNICKPYAIGFANWLQINNFISRPVGKWVIPLDTLSREYKEVTTQELYTLYLETL